MFENAKSDSKIIVHLNLKEETDRSEAVESAHATEKKPLMQKQPSSAVVWSIVVGSAILVSVTFQFAAQHIYMTMVCRSTVSNGRTVTIGMPLLSIRR